jgi:hypothetical protein
MPYFDDHDFRLSARPECTCGTWDSLHEPHCAHLAGRWDEDDHRDDAA